VGIALAIIGLAVLVLAHEAGHFFVALATRMRPRRFYVGFPPALAKVKHRGIEYGIGAVPLGGYVKIPGMFRPGKRDAELYLRPAAEEAGSLAEPLDALEGSFERDDLEQARADLALFESKLGTTELTPRNSRFARRGVEELDDALAPDAYWRQPTWKRLIVIAAGPVTNILIAVVIFASLYMLDLYRLGFQVKADKSGATTTQVDRVLADSPAKRSGLKAGDVVVDCDVLDVPGSGQHVVAYTAVTGSVAADRLDFLRATAGLALRVPSAG